jgi:uncharacterized protein YjaG (DUF416 family)
MTSQKINTLDDYEMFLGETIESWSPELRLALAAAMAERWLPAYDLFSTKEQWGDMDSLHHCLDAVWQHLLGSPVLSGSDRSRYLRQIHEVTPHMDDFDAIEALVACTILSDAVECCRMGNNTRYAIRALMSGFEAVNPDWSLDPDEQPRMWQTSVVRKELHKQMALLEQIGSLKKIDEQAIKALRQAMPQPEMAGEVLPREEPAAEAHLLSNQEAFEQYRRMVEMDLRGKDPKGADFKPEAIIFNVMLFAEWSGRYHRRLETIKGNYGRLADTQGMAVLVAMFLDRDSRVIEVPDWGKEMRWMFDLAIQNPMSGLDVTSLEQPHGYGPSLRRLWAEARQSGFTDENSHMAVVAWGRHRPEAWHEMDDLKKRGLVVDPALGKCLYRSVTWMRTNDPGLPWRAALGDDVWSIRINDFPDDYLYTLMINGMPSGNFNDWPEGWRRD